MRPSLRRAARTAPLALLLSLVACGGEPDEPRRELAAGDAPGPGRSAASHDGSRERDAGTSAGQADGSSLPEDAATDATDPGDELPPPSADGGWTRGESAGGAFEVAWRVVDAGAPPVNEHFTLELELTRPEGEARAPWDGADVEVRATMPEHRHGMLTRPEVVDEGGGRYRVPAMLFHMEGYWVLHVSARTGDGVSDVDQADFDLQVH